MTRIAGDTLDVPATSSGLDELHVRVIADSRTKNPREPEWNGNNRRGWPVCTLNNYRSPAARIKRKYLISLSYGDRSPLQRNVFAIHRREMMERFNLFSRGTASQRMVRAVLIAGERLMIHELQMFPRVPKQTAER